MGLKDPQTAQRQGGTSSVDAISWCANDANMQKKHGNRITEGLSPLDMSHCLGMSLKNRLTVSPLLCAAGPCSCGRKEHGTALPGHPLIKQFTI